MGWVIGGGLYDTSREAIEAAGQALGLGVKFVIKPANTNPRMWVWKSCQRPQSKRTTKQSPSGDELSAKGHG